MGVALGLLRLTLCDRHAGARRQRVRTANKPVIVDTASSAQRRAATRSPPASAASALRTRCSPVAWGTALASWPGPPRSRPAPSHIAGGQGRYSQHVVGGDRFKPAQLGGGLDGRVGGGPGRRVSPW